jgi:hypothetical protein
MYKVGEKLLCIKSSYYTDANNVIANNIYTVISVNMVNCDNIYYKINDGDMEFGNNSEYSRNFVSITEQRKEKLNKICSK